MSTWVDFVKTYTRSSPGEVPVVATPYGNNLTWEIKALDTSCSHDRLRRKGIKTPFGTPPIDDAAQAAWDRAKVLGGKYYELNMTREVTRRKRQIAAGQLTRSNGLVWPGQLASRMWKKGLGTGLFLRKPYSL